MVLRVFVEYWFIHHYHKCKSKDTKLRVMKIVFIRVIIRRKKSN